MLSLRFATLGCLLVALPALSFAAPGRTGDPQAAEAAPERVSYLGVGVVGMDEQIARELNWDGTGGLLVTVVQTASPAAKAGLQPDDIIVAFNGKQLRDPAALGSLVADLPPGRKVHLQVFRGGKTVQLSAVLAAREQRPGPEPLVRFDLPTPDTFFTDMPSPALRWRNSLMGVEYEGVDSQLAQFFGVKQGVLIRFVRPGSAGKEAGLEAGDIVTKVNGKAVANPRDFALALQNREQHKHGLAIEIMRDHKQRAMKIKLPRPDSTVSPWMHPVTAPFPQ
jgi:serine protease Do